VTVELRKTFFLVLLGHLVIFSLFSLSFGPGAFKVNYAEIASFGSILQNYDLIQQHLPERFKEVRLDIPQQLHQTFSQPQVPTQVYVKPQAEATFTVEKPVYIPNSQLFYSAKPKKESSIMFYPSLPYHFLLYFKDRHTVHIELEFKISSQQPNPIIIQRKISSGNLEADLLVMRHIEHYLFVHPASTTPDKWQSVEIDLSAAND
jgi:hypothetical protein